MDINLTSQIFVYTNLASFPATGAAKTFYVADDTEKLYRWTGSAYVEVSSGSVGTTWGAITGTLSNQTDLETALNTKEPTITAGTTSQYYRGDKTFQTLDKNTIGLGNVNNTSDANKPVSTAQQTALNAKQDSLGYTAENTANKTDLMSGNTTSSTKYLSAKGVYDWVISLGYITSSALTGYLTSATAAATYQVILTASNFGTFLTKLTGKTTPVDADEIVISDSAASNVAKKVTLTNFLAYLKAYFDPLYTNIIYSSAVDSTPTSGTSNTLCTGVLISANKYSNGKRLRALVRVRKNNTVGTVTLRVYVNSTNDLSGATLLGTYVSAAAHQLICTVFNYPFKSSTTVERFNATFTALTDEQAGGISLAPVTFTFDSTANRYLIFALQNSSASDTSYISYLTVEKL